MTIPLRLKILCVTAGSAVALVAVLLLSVRAAYTRAVDTRLAATLTRLEGLLRVELYDERRTVDAEARALAGEVRFANLLANADRAAGPERAALLAELPGLVREQDALRRIPADRFCWFLFGADDEVRCAARVARGQVPGRFGPVPPGAAATPEDAFAEAFFREFDTAVAQDGALDTAPERFEPSLRLLAGDDGVYVASRPWRVVEPAGPLVGFFLLASPLAGSRALHALAAAVGDPVLFARPDGIVAESLGHVVVPPEARAALAAAVAAAVAEGTHDAVIAGVTRRFVTTPVPVAGASDRLYGVIAFDLDRENAPMLEAQATVWRSAAAVLAGIVVVALLLAAGLARPIRRLVAATDRIAGGDLAVTVAVTSHDEIGQLAAHFNHMAEGLRERERMRGLLDKVVSQEVAGELMQLERDGKLALGGEVREVSVLFCDLRGFTATTEAMTPQDVIAMLNEYLTAVVAPIDAEHGVVDKFVGDEVMAIFGAPLAQADSAARAVRAAQGMQQAMGELNAVRVARGQKPLACGIGVNTGPAVAGLTGSRDRLSYTVLGATVNLAARLCSAAKPGQILVAEGTKAEVGDIALTALAPIAVKGFSAPVPIYAVGADVRDTRRLPGPGHPVDGGSLD